MTTIGTPSEKACATAPNAFSMPGPDWQQNTPTLSPEDKTADRVGHVYADALLAHDDRPDVGRRAGLGQRIERIGEEILDAFALEDLGGDLRDVHRGRL